MTATPPAPARERIVISGLFLLNGFGFANWATRIPDVQRRLALGEAELGVALLVAALGAIVAMPLVGLLLARRPVGRVTFALSLAFSVTLALPALAPSGVSLAMLLALFGAGIGGMDVAMNALAARHEAHAQRSVMAFFHGMYSLGGLLGAVSGGGLAALGVRPSVHLAVLAAAGLALVAMAGPTLAREKAPASDGPRIAWPRRELAVLALVGFCLLLGEGAMADWSALYLAKVLAATPGWAAAGFAAYSLCVAIGRFAGDRIIQRLGGGGVVRWGGALATLGILLVILAASAPLAVFGFALVGAGYSCIFPCLVSAAARSRTMPPGTAIAAVATFGYGGFLLGPPVIGFVAELADLRAGLGVVAVSALAVVVLGFAGWRGEASGR